MAAAEPTRLLTQRQVRALIDMPAVMDAVEEALVAHARGETQMPPKVYLEFEEYGGDLRAMPAFVAGAAGVKWINSHPRNPAQQGRPTVRGIYLLSDPANADLLAVMDATLITALRTGASAGLATRVLAREDVQTLGVIGAGAQAPHLIEAVRLARPSVRVLVADLEPARAEALARAVGGEAQGVRAVAEAADVLCTATPGRTPVVQRVWLREGTHVNAIGADAHGKQELDPRILDDARVFLDDPAQALASGEVNVPVASGRYDPASVAGTLGGVLAGVQQGRRHAAEITVFDSTGLAIQDAAVAMLAYRRAVAADVGTRLDFFA